MEKKYKTLNEFYPFYLTEHSHPVSRALHFLGTTGVIFLFFGGLLTGEYHLLFFLPLVGYGPAWIGHFFIEKNRPATFQYPLYSLASDFIMYKDILTGKIGDRLDEAHNNLKKS